MDKVLQLTDEIASDGRRQPQFYRGIEESDVVGLW